MDPWTVPWIGGAIVGGVLLMLLALSGVHLESRRRRHVPVLQDPGQVRRDNAIVLGVCLLMIVGGLLVGAALVWWVLP